MKTGNLFLVLAVTLVMTAGAFSEEVKRGHIAGKWITKEYGAMAGGLVLLFNAETGPPPLYEGQFRVPDAMYDIGPKGEFDAEVNAGAYYLVLRKVAGGRPGPPKDGEPHFFSLDKKGQPRRFTIRPGKTIDLGTIAEVIPFKRAVKSLAGSTFIEGTVYDDEGVPVEGAGVLAFLSPEMLGRPLYVSDSTGKDGKYVLRVNEGGTYYLKIRSHYGGGRPEAGEIMGGYGEQNDPAVVKVETGKVTKGIDISGKRFTGRGRQ